MAVIKRGKFNDKGQIPEEKVEVKTPELKVGDTVVLRKDLVVDKGYGMVRLTKALIDNFTRSHIIRNISVDGNAVMEEGVPYIYSLEMLELVEEPKVANLKGDKHNVKEEKKVSNRPKVSEHFPKEIEKMKIRVIGFYTKEEYGQIMDKIAQVVDNAKQGFVLLLDGFSFTTRYKKGKVTGVTVRRSTRTISL